MVGRIARGPAFEMGVCRFRPAVEWSEASEGREGSQFGGRDQGEGVVARRALAADEGIHCCRKGKSTAKYTLDDLNLSNYEFG